MTGHDGGLFADHAFAINADLPACAVHDVPVAREELPGVIGVVDDLHQVSEDLTTRRAVRDEVLDFHGDADVWGHLAGVVRGCGTGHWCQHTFARRTLACMSINEEFLFALLAQAAPSGFERRAADVWLKEATSFARTSEDHYGNVYAELGPQGAPAIILTGHLDEIGLMVSHVNDKGFLHLLGIGGWDPQVLVGQRVRLLAPEGDMIGVIGKKAIHVMDEEDRKKASKLEDLWIDVDMTADEARRRIPVGTVAVIEQPTVKMGSKIVSKALDNRVGAFIVLEALRALKDVNLKHRVVAVGTSQEEIGSFGSHTATYRVNPIAGVAVDLTHETEQPGVKAEKYGVAPFGSGANLSVGAMTSPVIYRQMQDAAKKENIPYSISANPRYTFTDGDTMALSRAGVPTAVVSVPNRYMHSPNEMVDARDVKACIDLIAAWIRGLEEGQDFKRQG